jgi:uncharacterized surface protein with fasciclin (FAS1) repeats
MQHRFTGILASATLIAGLLGAAGAANAASCAEALVSNSKLSRFSAIVQQAGLAPQLATGTLTVFAPTNDALNGISSITQMLGGQSANAQPDFPKLQTLVRAHLVQGLHPENDMHGKVTLSTLAGTSLAIDGTGQRAIMLSASASNGINLSGTHAMSNVHVAGPAIECDNGIIYPIDNALVQ